MIGDKAVDLKMARVAEENGRIFLLARDEKSRILEWYLIDPLKKDVIDKGKCPFAAFNLYAFSPDGKTVLALSRYPAILWSLDISRKQWNKLYQNTTVSGEQFTISNTTPFAIVSSTKAYSVLDKIDDKKCITDTCIVCFNPCDFHFEKIVSSRDLRRKAFEMAMPITGKMKPFKDYSANMLDSHINYIRYGDDNSLCFNLRIVSKKNKKNLQDLLYYFKAPSTLECIDNADGYVQPLYISTKKDCIIYKKTTQNSLTEVYVTEKGKKEKIIDLSALVAGYIDNDTIGIAALKKKTLEIHICKKGEKPQKVEAFTNSYKVCFLREVGIIVFVGKDRIKCFRIIP
ncbi:MAG: hypothetical protein AB2L14_15050 [Candidatus Xenobiia bacterium LiM19]